jgi:hypothetical protein
MYCPKCGKENAADQRFCRSCGLRLERISQSVVEELVGSAGRQADVAPRESKRSLRGLLAGFLLMMSGVIVVVVGKDILPSRLMGSIGALIAILGLAVMGLFALMSLAPARRARHTPASPDAGTLPEPATLLDLGPRLSVTEHTTQHLENAPAHSGRPEGARVTQPTE